MKNFKKEFEKKLMSEEIVLPESLSAENIERLINENGGIVEPKRVRSINKKNVIRWCSAAAAAIVLIIGVGAVVQNTNNDIAVEDQQQIIEENVESSAYSEIEKNILSYFKDIYNSRYVVQNYADGFGLGSIFGDKDAESADDAALGTNSASNSNGSNNVPGDFTADSVVNEEGSFNTTNTQVEGVDEADIIKNDGKYIYYLRQNSYDITITRCDNPEDMVIVGRIKLKEDDDKDIYPVEMFLYGDTITVISHEYLEYETETTYSGMVTADSCCIALKSDTLIRMFDVKDKENPKEIYSQKMSGDYISSRIADGKLIVVTSFSIPYSSVRADDFDDACQVVKEICIPEYSVNGGEMQRIPAERIEMFDENNPTTYTVTSIISLDSKEKVPMMNAFLGGADEIYCTADEIFVAETKHSYWTAEKEEKVMDSNGTEFVSVTTIHKMNITNEGVEYIANVTVGGMGINQFSMDKHGDYFRIATNGMKHYGKRYMSMVYVIDKDMKIVGYLDGIAEGEDMKSARFMGDTLYLVTFMQTDPLFVVDLSDPTKPEIKGELKIPGFSNYLHPIGNGLVIGIGAGGTTTGTDGTAKISLFDVSDPYNPKELDNYSTSEPAEFVGDHKGFMVIDENTYAASLCVNYFSGAVIVFSIVDGGIVIDELYMSKSGGNSNAVRGSFIDTTFFVVNDMGIIAYDMTKKDIADDKVIDNISF